MCGRYAITHSHKELIERFAIEEAMMEWEPRYNIAPSQVVPVVIAERLEGGGDEAREFRTLQPCKWGLLPSWAKDPKKIKPMINARAETIAEKPMFRSAFKRRRCLIPTDGFYEWRLVDGKRSPVFIHLKERPLFAFAGLYEDWTSPEGEKIRTCSIVTVGASERLSGVHDRMPAILPPQAESLWIDPTEEDRAKLLSLLAPYSSDAVDYYEVSTEVNSYRKDSPELVKPV